MANPFLVLGGVAVGVVTAGIGVLQVPGWIDAANDSAVMSDLTQVSLAQESASTSAGKYVELAALESGSVESTALGVKLQRSSGVPLFAVSNVGGDRWAAIGRSKSGYVFVRTSDSTRVIRSDKKIVDAATITNADFPELPVSIYAGGIGGTPTISFAGPLPTEASGWKAARGSNVADWVSNSLPGKAVHPATIAHSALLTSADVVNQTDGFTVSADLRLADGTPLAGIALGSSTDALTIAIDERSKTGTAASLQMRSNFDTASVQPLLVNHKILRDTTYNLSLTVVGNSLRAVLTEVASGTIITDTTVTVPFPTFTGITRVGVYGHQGATISNLVVR
ncbi:MULTISPECIES: hypothetical protein [Microbacterium]|uniref:hypothetical protein n=1 Tax=Microbacterium TaxID=33882 RepID=UPI00034EA3D0|nr:MULTISPECIES: hypothetical protein [Microbacterium]EPD84293.1 hypothetical protein HMPREF1529_02358 [Microbacterium sp. oral taxon 186 str. F0373]